MGKKSFFAKFGSFILAVGILSFVVGAWGLLRSYPPIYTLGFGAGVIALGALFGFIKWSEVPAIIRR